MTWLRRMGPARLASVEDRLGSFTITEDGTGTSITIDLTPEAAVQWVTALTDALARTGVTVLTRRKES